MIEANIETRTIVGMEIHVQLATKTKMFCGCKLEFGAEPNTRACPVCLGLPGALPVINGKAVEHSVRMGLALGCEVSTFTKWDRKSYYYPDLPKNYQTSQYDLPLCHDGSLEIATSDGKTKHIRIIRAHLEEDAGKNIHDTPGCSLVDLNRAGTPLLEIVTHPDISSGEEAYAFCTELQRLVTDLGIGEASMQKGQMRFEPNVNIAITYNGNECYTPISEVKNLNSFKAVRDAIEYESRRQLQDWLANREYVKGKSPNENRGWNADRGITEFQRGKEAAHDYRYFPDPDLVPLKPTGYWVEAIRSCIPELPLNRRKRFISEYGIDKRDCPVILRDRETEGYYEYCVTRGAIPSTVTKQFMGIWNSLANANATTIGRLGIRPEYFFELAQLADEGTLSAAGAAALAEHLYNKRNTLRQLDIDFLISNSRCREALDKNSLSVGLRKIAAKKGLLQVQDESQVVDWVDQALAANAQAIKDAIGNPKKAKAATGFLAGQVMRASNGMADPRLVAKIIADRLASMNN